MYAIFEDLATAKAAFALGSITIKCLVCGDVHDYFNSDVTECISSLWNNLVSLVVKYGNLRTDKTYEIINKINLMAATRAAAVFPLHDKIYRACEPGPYWLAMKNTLPLVKCIVFERLDDECREYLKIKL